MSRGWWVAALWWGCGPGPSPSVATGADEPPLPACPSDTSPEWGCVTPPTPDLSVDECPGTARLKTRLGEDEAAPHVPELTRHQRASSGGDGRCCYVSCRPLYVQTTPAPGSCEGGLEPHTSCIAMPGFTSSAPAPAPYEVCPVALLRGQGPQWAGVVGGLYFDAALTEAHGDGRQCCYRGCAED